jgi:glycine/D-amino acid oxidase-like deaminating enzyme
MSKPIPSSCTVLIVGGKERFETLISYSISFATLTLYSGGIAGCSAAYHLVQAGVQNILLLEAGTPGDGRFEPIQPPPHASLREGDFGGEPEKNYQFAQRSGSAVLPAPASNIKMMVNLYPCSSADFCLHHGKDGARRYLALAAAGIEIEKELSRLTMTSDDLFRSYGSLYVAERKDVPDLQEEYMLLVELNCPGVEWWDEDKVNQYAGGESAKFGGGIYFPHDGVINSGQVF